MFMPNAKSRIVSGDTPLSRGPGGYLFAYLGGLGLGGGEGELQLGEGVIVAQQPAVFGAGFGRGHAPDLLRGPGGLVGFGEHRAAGYGYAQVFVLLGLYYLPLEEAAEALRARDDEPELHVRRIGAQAEDGHQRARLVLMKHRRGLAHA